MSLYVVAGCSFPPLPPLDDGRGTVDAGPGGDGGANLADGNEPSHEVADGSLAHG